jgi:hypothetical protein
VHARTHTPDNLLDVRAGAVAQVGERPAHVTEHLSVRGLKSLCVVLGENKEETSRLVLVT